MQSLKLNLLDHVSQQLTHYIIQCFIFDSSLEIESAYISNKTVLSVIVFKVVHQENELSTLRTEQITYLKTFTFYIKTMRRKTFAGRQVSVALIF